MQYRLKLCLVAVLLFYNAYHVCLAIGKEKDFISNLGLDIHIFDFYVSERDTILYLSQDTIRHDFILIKSKNRESIPYIVYFPNTVFYGLVSFQNMIFEKPVYFQAVCFNENAIFMNARFKQDTYFINSNFRANANFKGAVFEGLANFHAVDFYSGTFQDAIFEDTAIFTKTEFIKSFDFSYTKFKGYLDFGYSQFLSRPYFNGTFLPQKVDLTYVIAQNEIDFTVINENDSLNEHKIDLFGSSIDKIKFSYGKNTLMVSDRLSNDQKCYLYQNLLSRFEELGFVDSRRLLDLEFKKYLAFKDNSFFKKTEYYISKIWWNFGYEKSRILWFTIGFLFLFFILNTVFFRIVRTVYYIESIQKKYNLRSKQSYGLIETFSLKNCLMSFYFTIILFFGFKFDISNIRLPRLGWVLYLIVIYLTGFLCLAFIIKYIISI